MNFQSLILYLNQNNARCSDDQMGKYNGNALERFKPDFFRFFLTAAVFACKVHDFPFCATMRKFRKKVQTQRAERCKAPLIVRFADAPNSQIMKMENTSDVKNVEYNNKQFISRFWVRDVITDNRTRKSPSKIIIIKETFSLITSICVKKKYGDRFV